MPELKRPICEFCGTPMWKKEIKFPLSKNPRQSWICGQCGKCKNLPIADIMRYLDHK